MLGEASWRRSSLPAPGANYTEAPEAHRCLLSASVGSLFKENLLRVLAFIHQSPNAHVGQLHPLQSGALDIVYMIDSQAYIFANCLAHHKGGLSTIGSKGDIHSA